MYFELLLVRNKRHSAPDYATVASAVRGYLTVTHLSAAWQEAIIIKAIAVDVCRERL